MKKILSCLFLCALGVGGKAQTKFQVEGKISLDSNVIKAVYQYSVGEKFINDTVAVTDRKFSFSGEVSRPSLIFVGLLTPWDLSKKKGNPMEEIQDSKKTALFYADGNLSVNWDEKGPVFKGGGVEQKVWLNYLKLSDEMNTKSPNPEDGIEEFEKNIAVFIKGNPDSYVSLDLVNTFFAGAIVPKTFEPVYNTLSPKLKATAEATSWMKSLEAAKLFGEGQPAVDFTQNDANGNPITLKSFRGKYVLLDFWASWCGPCRATHPELTKTYQKFKSDKFTILGVSMDNSKEQWLKAIEADGLNWVQVSDLKGPSNSVGKLYNVTSIPQNFLIDPNGIIVGRNLHGASLDKKLSEFLK